MTTHLEDPKVSGVHRAPSGMGFMYRYGALCGVTFYGNDPEHTLVNPHQPKHRELTCKGCIAKQGKGKPCS